MKAHGNAAPRGESPLQTDPLCKTSEKVTEYVSIDINFNVLS
jgi:hypothetical protein